MNLKVVAKSCAIVHVFFFPESNGDLDFNKLFSTAKVNRGNCDRNEEVLGEK
jgi:hypothetical protein